MKTKENLKKLYKKLRPEIKKRLAEFKKNLNESSKDLFVELAFCILTPQSKAENCWQIIEILREENLLFYGDEGKIRKKLRKIRFNKRKAKYIVLAREKFFEKDFKKLIKNLKDPYVCLLYTSDAADE